MTHGPHSKYPDDGINSPFFMIPLTLIIIDLFFRRLPIYFLNLFIPTQNTTTKFSQQQIIKFTEEENTVKERIKVVDSQLQKLRDSLSRITIDSNFVAFSLINRKVPILEKEHHSLKERLKKIQGSLSPLAKPERKFTLSNFLDNPSFRKFIFKLVVSSIYYLFVIWSFYLFVFVHLLTDSSFQVVGIVDVPLVYPLKQFFSIPFVETSQNPDGTFLLSTFTWFLISMRSVSFLLNMIVSLDS